MIFDKIKNLDQYKCFSAVIYAGLKYLSEVSPSVENGVYQINDKVKAIVSEYSTKTVNPNGYEARRKNIDIQSPIRGIEKVKCTPIVDLKVSKEYDTDNDYLLYSDDTTSKRVSELVIGEGYFTILFPQDGHEPQLCVDEPEMIKKITIKVQL